jgi:mono/diheme cytochrome c family protein
MRSVFGALFLIVALVHVESAAAQGNAEPGKKMWESVDARCRDCHGEKGEGGFGPDLAGRQLSYDQFKQAVRKPWGIMPSFTEQQISDADIANFLAYFSSLPKVAGPGAWKTPMPAQPKHGDTLFVATYGCAQCHGATLNGPRGNAGAVNADFEWFKKMVYEHTAYMPQHRTIVGAQPTGVRMGNFSRMRLPESVLQEMFLYMKDELKFRPAIAARLTPGASTGTYSLEVLNNGLAGKGLSAENVTISLALAPGTKVTNTTGAGYQGVRKDTDGKTDVAVWQVPRLGPKDKQSYTITLSGGTIPKGSVIWAKPAPGSGGPDVIAVAVPPPPPQTR